MDKEIKAQIGARLRAKRERAGYTREELGELCSLSPRFIANVEFGDSAVSLDTLITLCRTLSCSADALLFGDEISEQAWDDTIEKIRHLDVRYQRELDGIIQFFIAAVVKSD